MAQQQQSQQKEHPKIPDIFYLKPMNNFQQEKQKMNNVVCKCNCHLHHQENQVLKPERVQWAKFKQTMFSRVKRTRIIMAMVGIICFAFGIAIPFLFHFNTKNGAGSKEKSFYHNDFMTIQRQKHMIPPILPQALTNRQHKLRNNSLQDVYISVKTTKKYHYPRLVIQLETWVSLVKDQTWFFTDTFDAHLTERTNGHLIHTNCSESHSRVALACKMGAEFDTFLKSHKPWWCHFDDDNYVHVLRLAHLLQSYSADSPVYLGKPSTARPIEIWDLNAPQNVSEFWFATGGAGFCVSRTLALKMAPFTANGKLVRTGEEFWFPDDVSLGYIIEHILKENLTVIPQFHSHLEPMRNIGDIDSQITLSFSEANTISLDGPFSKQVDPTRFYSLHCRLYGGSYCPS